ncbi:MAG: MBL fold metallo-hydrolase [Halobacteriaceae archaeon]
MVHSDWGDWLPTAVADADPDGVAVWYLGCNGFVLKASDGTTLFVDPYLGTGKPPRTVRMIPVPFDPEDVLEADAVFATHEHSDHVHAGSQAPLLADHGADFYGSSSCTDVAASWTDEWAVDADQFRTVEPGDTVEVGGFSVHVETAHDPDAAEPVSYVFEHGGRTVFHGGDTKPADEFADLGETYDVDLGILAFGSAGNIADAETGELRYRKWYNDENQVVEAASDLRFDRLLPSHWDMWKGMTADPAALGHHVASFEFLRDLELVEIGDRVDV